MTIENRPIPRFIADASQHGIPHGRFAERLSTVFRDACVGISDLPEGTEPPDEIVWFPERAWSGRVWVPASAAGTAVMEEGGEPVTIEFFGFVSFIQPTGGDPEDFRASADFTDVIAAEIRPLVDQIRIEREQPLIAEIPGPDGPMPGRKTLRQFVQEAVGIRVGLEEKP